MQRSSCSGYHMCKGPVTGRSRVKSRRPMWPEPGHQGRQSWPWRNLFHYFEGERILQLTLWCQKQNWTEVRMFKRYLRSKIHRLCIHFVGMTSKHKCDFWPVYGGELSQCLRTSQKWPRIRNQDPAFSLALYFLSSLSKRGSRDTLKRERVGGRIILVCESIKYLAFMAFLA